MGLKVIKCPKCASSLDVSNPTNEPTRIVKCSNPNCQARFRVAFDTGKTILDNPQNRNGVIGSLRCGGSIFQLQEGRNTIGRKSSRSDATIQIDTHDLSMSRQHAEITVVRLPSGRVKALFGDCRSKEKAAQKPVLLEDVPLDIVDRVVLCHGDSLVLGNTTLRYVQE